MNWNHDHLAIDLAQHLRRNNDRIVWFDMQLGPSGSPRPDVYTIPKTYSRFTPLAYECKISVADFRSDITSGKWQKYLKFAAGVIFAVPAGLINKDDVPKGCGLIVRSENGWRSAKGPTLAKFDTLPHDAWMKLMIDGMARQVFNPQPREAGIWQVKEKIRQKYGQELAEALSNRDMALHYLQQQTDRLHKEKKMLVDEMEKERKAAHARMTAEEPSISELRRMLCSELELPEEASLHQIRHKTSERLKRLNESEEVKRAIEHVKAIQRSLNYAMKDVEKALEPAQAAIPVAAGSDDLIG